jgi:hypothetical protein
MATHPPFLRRNRDLGPDCREEEAGEDGGDEQTSGQEDLVFPLPVAAMRQSIIVQSL